MCMNEVSVDGVLGRWLREHPIATGHELARWLGRTASVALLGHAASMDARQNGHRKGDRFNG